MSADESGLALANAPRSAFAPALLLALAVVLLMNTGTYGGLGLQAIFASFVVGVAVTPLSVVIYALGAASERTLGALFGLGLSLAGTAVVLYLVYGCVFGCPG